MQDKNITVSNNRLVSIDLMRFLAIFLMFADHAIKLFYNFTPTLSSGDTFVNIARLILYSTTFSAPLFLFLVGISSVLSINKRSQEQYWDWLKNKFRTGIFYIIISFPLFFYQEASFDIPYTSGVLQLIGTSLIIVSIILVYIKKRRSVLFSLLTLGIIILDAILKNADIHIPVITKINFPILPYIVYVFAGSLIAELLINRKNNKQILKIVGILSSLSVLFFLFLSGFNPFHITATYSVVEGYIIHSTLMLIYYISLMTTILVILMMLEDKLRRSKLIEQFALIGKEALNIYILHIILGWGVSKYILKNQRFDFWVSVAVILIFTFLGWLWAKARQRGYFQFVP